MMMSKVSVQKDVWYGNQQREGQKAKRPPAKGRQPHGNLAKHWEVFTEDLDDGLEEELLDEDAQNDDVA